MNGDDVVVVIVVVIVGGGWLHRMRSSSGRMGCMNVGPHKSDCSFATVGFLRDSVWLIDSDHWVLHNLLLVALPTFLHRRQFDARGGVTAIVRCRGSRRRTLGLKQLLNFVQGQSRRFGHLKVKVNFAHHHNDGVQKKGLGVSPPARERQEGQADQKVGQPKDGRGLGDALAPVLDGVDFRVDGVGHGAQSQPKAKQIKAHAKDGKARRVGRKTEGNQHQADPHQRHAQQERTPTTALVDNGIANENAQQLHRHEGYREPNIERVAMLVRFAVVVFLFAHSRRSNDAGAVIHNRVDPRQLTHGPQHATQRHGPPDRRMGAPQFPQRNAVTLFGQFVFVDNFFQFEFNVVVLVDGLLFFFPLRRRQPPNLIKDFARILGPSLQDQPRRTGR
mmetsp:Transcript_18815/g.43899  ORF Transcript_18815/g.43899 Transcript_18815/m.43899 type:complete len:390 (-) Transcript_18815:289-1458(-)